MENKYSLRRIVSYSCLVLFALFCILMLQFSTISVDSELIKMFGGGEPDNGFVWMRFESNFFEADSDEELILMITAGSLSIIQLIIGVSVLSAVISNFLKGKDDANKKPIIWGIVSMSMYALEGLIIKIICNLENSYGAEYISTSSYVPLIIGVILVIGYNLTLMYLPDANFSSGGAFSKNSSALNEASKTEALSKYKRLLDDGVITQEEFEAKKKQLLGL